MPRELKKRLMNKVRALFSCHSKTPQKTFPCNNSTSISEPPKIVMERRSNGSPSDQLVKQKPRGIRFSRRAVQRSKYLREKFGVRKTVMGFSPREGSISEEDESDITLWRLAENAEDVISNGLAWLKNDDGDDDDGDGSDDYDNDEKILQRWIESTSFDSLNNYDGNYGDGDDANLLSDDDSGNDNNVVDNDDHVNHYVGNNCYKDCNHDGDDNEAYDDNGSNDDDDDNDDNDNGGSDTDRPGEIDDDVKDDNDGSDIWDDVVFISSDDLDSDRNNGMKDTNDDNGDYNDDHDENNRPVQKPTAEKYCRKRITKNVSHPCYLSNHIIGSQDTSSVCSLAVNECVDINSNNCLHQSLFGDKSLIKGRQEKYMNQNCSLNGIKMSKISPKGALTSSTIKIGESIQRNSHNASIKGHKFEISANCNGNRRSSSPDVENDDDDDTANVLKGDVRDNFEFDFTSAARHGSTMLPTVMSKIATTLESHSTDTPMLENANSTRRLAEAANVSTKPESDRIRGSSVTSVFVEKEKLGSMESEEFGVGNENNDLDFGNLVNSMKKDMEVVWNRMVNIENDFILVRTTLNEMRITKKN